jgi:uncharacterized protein YkwD
MNRGAETVLPLVLPLALLLLAASSAYGECPQAHGDEMLGWISTIRGAVGLGPLEMDPILEHVAGEYAHELARRGVLSHRDARGRDALDRTQLAGGTATIIGEILGSGPGPAEVGAAWAASRTHRSVVENPLWTHVGAGCTVLGTRQVWVVLFAAKRIRSLRIEARTMKARFPRARLPRARSTSRDTRCRGGSRPELICSPYCCPDCGSWNRSCGCLKRGSFSTAFLRAPGTFIIVWATGILREG